MKITSTHTQRHTHVNFNFIHSHNGSKGKNLLFPKHSDIVEHLKITSLLLVSYNPFSYLKTSSIRLMFNMKRMMSNIRNPSQ